ncbi:DVUA0089 family protein [Sphingomonas sp. XXL09]|uniref:DVUA0089 family protein n=1 Tax=Sphingomonas sp. XXL09 TaxID=3457787 RepID=UPI00406BD86B
MKKMMKAALAAAALLAAPNAFAATTVSGSLNSSGVKDYFFSFTGGSYSIAVDSTFFNGIGDPEVFLFKDNGSPGTGLTGALVDHNDDRGFFNYNSLLDGTLSAGNYVLAIGQYDFTQAEARSGSANFTRGATNFQVTFSNGITLNAGPTGAVPEPATWAMMILGMGAVGYAMRRAKRSSDAKFDAKIQRITAGALT